MSRIAEFTTSQIVRFLRETIRGERDARRKYRAPANHKLDEALKMLDQLDAVDKR